MVRGTCALPHGSGKEVKVAVFAEGEAATAALDVIESVGMPVPPVGGEAVIDGEADHPLPVGEFVPMRVDLFAVAHSFRAGSRIRISIAAPGGDRTRWAFDTYQTRGLMTNDIARTRLMPSRLVLPVVRAEVM